MNKDQFRKKLTQLIQNFSNNEEYYKSKDYKEDQLRQEFINPMFRALGWDMDNEQGFAPQYREVIHEDRIEIEGKPKAPDYSFKVGSDRKFFVEAKASSVRVISEIDPSFQLRRYAWSGKLPVSILTDFEEFAVYDTTIEPKSTDKASIARIKYINYKDYLKEIDYLWDTFSKEAVWKGSFDKFARKEKKGIQLVDKAFLKEIELWRELLAKDIESNNRLDIYQLNEVVQKFIDRLIFLRIAEDRGIESYENLKKTIDYPDTYSQLLKIFKRAQDKYNSNLFNFTDDKLSLEIKVSDKVLDRIISHLYYPKSPYEFSVIGVEILGSVYEQFLGKVIRLTKGGNAVIEEKPEVKKAGGVYYTPQYIVDYIVKNTVGELVKDKQPKDVSKLKIVDPACGSGSFLIGAYSYLLDWHLEYYTNNSPAKYLKSKVLFKDRDGILRISTAEKKRILVNNIYGVDIDPQAVEVTKLSLALKMLEDENSDTINAQFVMFADRILPDLSTNIKCGNSLISSDFYESQTLSLIDNEYMRKVNTFDWNSSFPTIIRNGGFDSVIGNPPWGASFSPEELNYVKDKSKEIIVRMIDSFMFFVHRSSKLVKKNGFWGMIIPDVILYQKDNQRLREYLLTKSSIKYALNLGDVFEKVTRPSAIIIFKNSKESSKIKVSNLTQISKEQKKIVIYQNDIYTNVEVPFIESLPNKIIVTEKVNGYKILGKILNGTDTKLKDILDADGIQRGVSPDLKDAFVISENNERFASIEKVLLKKVVTGGHEIKRYQLSYGNKYLIYLDKTSDITNYPKTKLYIDSFKEKITCKEVKQGKHSLYALHRARDKSIFEKPKKLLGVITEDEIVVTKDENQIYATDGVYVLSPSESELMDYLLGILNSRLYTFLYQLVATEKGRVLAQVKPSILAELPMVIPNKKSKLTIESKVGELLSISTNDTKKRELLQNQINKLIYNIFSLTEDEIAIVEDNDVI